MNTMIEHSALERLHAIGGDRLLSGMLDLFLANLPLRVARVRDGLADSDASAVRQAAHSLKSTAANLGAMVLSRLSQQIESSADAEDLEAVARMADELYACADATLAALVAYRDDRYAIETVLAAVGHG